jgi:hypothetical protein
VLDCVHASPGCSVGRGTGTDSPVTGSVWLIVQLSAETPPLPCCTARFWATISGVSTWSPLTSSVQVV